MKESVYIETSVISYYTSKRSRDIIISARQAITREKWIKIVSSFKVFVSALVIQEIEKGDSKAAQQRLASIQKFSILAMDNRAEQLAKRLIEKSGSTRVSWRCATYCTGGSPWYGLSTNLEFYSY